MKKWLTAFIQQVIRYMGCGAVCGVVDYGLMILLTEVFDVMYLVSTAIAYVVAMTMNFFISSRFVFDHKEKRKYDLPVFLLMGIVAMGLNLAVMWLVTEKLGIVYYISKFAGAAASGIWNFFSRKFLLEKHLLRSGENC